MLVFFNTTIVNVIKFSMNCMMVASLKMLSEVAIFWISCIFLNTTCTRPYL